MALPPSLTGAVKVTLAVVAPGVAAPMVGAPGPPAGVTLLDAADAALVPDVELIASDIEQTFERLCELPAQAPAPWQQRARQRRDAKRVA